MIVGLGEILWDVLPEGKKLGGAPANFAYHAAQLGLNSIAVSAIGNDALGDEIEQYLQQYHLQALLPRVDFPTGTVDVQLSGQGIPTYQIHEGVAWDNIPVSSDLIRIAKQARVVCFGSLAQRSSVSRQTIRRFIEEMPTGAHCYRVFDINLRQHYYDVETISASLELCNVLKINDEELAIVGDMFGLGGISDADKCWALLGRYGLKMLILTCGTKGSYVYSPGKVSYQPTPLVEVADTVGAGDSFSAAFVSAIVQGWTIEEAHQRAVNISAYVCTQHGAMPRLPEELIQRRYL